MVEIYDKDGSVCLDATDYQLKADTSRMIYIQTPKDKQYRSLNHEMPLGLTLDEKKAYLNTLHLMIQKRLSEQNQQE